jgi:hypothetical protein
MQNEEPVSPRADERLAATMPDPSGPPQAVEANDPVLRTIAAAGVTLVAAGGVMLAMCSGAGPTAGATRSAKLQWEYRQHQAEKAQQADQGHQAPPAALGADESESHD